MKCEYDLCIVRGLNVPRFRRCHKPATCVCNGIHYCSIHDPVRVEERRQKREAIKKEKFYETMNLYVAQLRARQIKK
jgi:hypothetical protein